MGNPIKSDLFENKMLFLAGRDKNINAEWIPAWRQV